jgi:protein-disulfide isomerase
VTEELILRPELESITSEPDPTVVTQPPLQAQSAKNDDKVVLSRTTMNYFVIAVSFLVLGLFLGTTYFSSSATIDEDAIGAVVRELLVEAELLHPHIDDMTTLVDDDPYMGDEDAPIIIVEFSAYACPFCGRHYNETLQPILENYGQYIRYVYRDHPIINQNVSFPAALAANCALEQGAFWDYHRMLFENQTSLGPSFFVQAAEDLGLDKEQFQACYDAQTYADEVIGDFNDGSDLNITGTPGFYINGGFHSGAQPYEYFESVILEELNKLGIDPARQG